MDCQSAIELGKKLGISHDKLIIIASMSGAVVDWKKGLPYICGELDNKIVNDYVDIIKRVNNNEIVEIDRNMLSLFRRGYTLISAYGSLYVTRRVIVPSEYLSKFPEYKEQVILFANKYYLPPEILMQIKIAMKREEQRKNVIIIDDLDE